MKSTSLLIINFLWPDFPICILWNAQCNLWKYTSLLSFNFLFISSGTWAYATHSNTLKCDTLHFIPLQASSDTIFYHLCGKPIQNVYRTSNCFTPKLIGYMFFFQQNSIHVHDYSIIPFYYTILMWCVPGCEFSIDFNFLQYVVNYLDSYSPPWSNLNILIYWPVFFWTWDLNSLKLSKVSYLNFKMYTQAFLLKSSINV